MSTTTHVRQVLESFVAQRTVLLTSFRRDGTPVGTPVNIAVEGDRAFIRSFDAAWKVKRMGPQPGGGGRALDVPRRAAGPGHPSEGSSAER